MPEALPPLAVTRPAALLPCPADAAPAADRPPALAPPAAVTRPRPNPLPCEEPEVASEPSAVTMPREPELAAKPEAVVMPCEEWPLPTIVEDEPVAVTMPLWPCPLSVDVDEEPLAVTMPLWPCPLSVDEEPLAVTTPRCEVARLFEATVDVVPVDGVPDVESDAILACADLSELTTGPSLVPSACAICPQPMPSARIS